MTEPQRVAPDPRVFISHSSSDKPFVRKLVHDLVESNVDVFFDEVALSPGDSIVDSISGAIRDTNYLIVVLSPASVDSLWVQREINAALYREIDRRGMLVIPLLLHECELPPILADKLYLDFTGGESAYDEQFQRLRSVLRMESSPPRVSASIPAPPTPPGRPELHDCVTFLRRLSPADLRRLVQSLSLTDLALLWHAVFNERLEDMLPKEPKPKCAVELVLTADERGLRELLIEEYCKDFGHRTPRSGS